MVSESDPRPHRETVVTGRDPTRIGEVRHVLGSTVTVALDSDLAGTAPIYRGRLQSVGQIGSLVRIPQGPVDLIATVGLVGIAELSGPVAPAEAVQHDKRWLQVQLLGSIDRGTGRFQRGVGAYPGLDDPVHFATTEQLKSVFPHPDARHLCLGRLAAATDVPVCVDVARFVVRHAAIVGSTSSGKTSAVASLLQGFVSEGWSASNIVVIDPHGEYPHALSDRAAVKSVLATGDAQLRVPFWALPATEIISTFCGSGGGPTFRSRFAELVTEHRRKFVSDAEWLSLDPSAVTSDTPVPFDIRSVWYRLDEENSETLDKKGDPNSVCRIEVGDASQLRSSVYKPYAAGGKPPHKGPYHGAYGTMPSLLRLGLLDPQLRFF